jgi:hypothetical protein
MNFSDTCLRNRAKYQKVVIHILHAEYFHVPSSQIRSKRNDGLGNPFLLRNFSKTKQALMRQNIGLKWCPKYIHQRFGSSC